MDRLPPGTGLPACPDLHMEQDLWRGGLSRVAGIDEAGRGALAGPVVAAAVVLPADNAVRERLSGVRDSKQMTAAQRDYWAERIRAEALECAVGWASCGEIDQLNIYQATRLAMTRAVQSLSALPEQLLLDAMRLPELNCPQLALIKGDMRSLSIAAASVLAKTWRDARMEELEACYPGYGFAAHKGYGTVAHRSALAALGPCPEHRRSFAPLRLVKELP